MPPKYGARNNGDDFEEKNINIDVLNYVQIYFENFNDMILILASLVIIIKLV